MTEDAIQSRETISFARGVLMACEYLDPDNAYRRLIELAQHSRTSVRQAVASTTQTAEGG
ncbi:ANTAR domain-containing protein [Nocardia iowensis]|uniref:ANTAR domain-containing protein n=1 Tax=Nocardia iowensis TaxID=204891 RepID=A0ABX8RX06_NOCIO|nr:ANTAR domain-containing protein [Nocardia iowensis]QXN94178.1 ANTAR domain-containing protein [Nocardia iowensis]